MEKYFKLEGGELVNVIEHCVEQLSLHPNLKLYIGTDSQVFRRETVFATAIVFRYGVRGAHYIYHIERTPKKKYTHFERLFREAELTIGAAEMIKENCSISIEALEFDYNAIKKTLSSNLISIARGWALGLGFTPVFKNGMMIASKAADHIARKK